MPRWLFPLLATVFTSGIGIAINVATDLGTSVFAWVMVGVLTLASGALTVFTMPSGSTNGNVSNKVTGTVHGASVQARDISAPITFSSD